MNTTLQLHSTDTSHTKESETKKRWDGGGISWTCCIHFTEGTAQVGMEGFYKSGHSRLLLFLNLELHV